MESLERRELLAGDLGITNLQLTTFQGDPVDQVIVGEQVYLRADWTDDGLAKDDGYLVRFSVDGEELDSAGLIYPRSGVVVLRNSFGVLSQGGPTDTGRYWIRGEWFATSGTHNVTVTIDADNTVAETNEGNNTMSFSFTTVNPDTLPSKLVWPVGGQQNVDWTCCNYIAVHPGKDFAGGSLTIPGHSGLDIAIATFGKMDEGVPVYAVAAGTVTKVSDGNYDRTGDGTGQGEGSNGVSIANGDGWTSFYGHMARDTITVQDGDLVTPGQLLGYVGSSGGNRPHLHFELRHYGGLVETFYAPELYWQTSPPYVLDTERSYMDFGITNLALTFPEPPPPMNVFPNDLPGSTPLHFWYVLSHRRSGEVIRRKFIRPNGTLRFDAEFTSAKNGNVGGVLESILFKGNFNAVGTWYWVLEVNGVEKLRAPFEVTSGAAVAGIRVTQDDVLIIDGRTTPSDLGSVAVNSAASQETFTIKNHGYAVLTLSDLTLPPGFSLLGSFPATIDPGDKIEFILQLDTTRAGKKFGEVRFTTNDPETPLFNFNIEGEVVGAPPAGSPVIELPGPVLGYAFRQGPVIIDRAATVSDSTDFRGGSLVVEMAGGITPEDRLAVRNQGREPNEIGVSGSTITFAGTEIAAFSGGAGANPLVIDFNNTVSLDAASELLRSITFANIAQTPSTRPRYIRFTLTNGAGQISNQPIKKVVLADFEHNVPPRVGSVIVDHVIDEASKINFVIPASTFFDNNTFESELTLSATLTDGADLPDWLSFDPESRRFQGTPADQDVGQTTIRVTATDIGGLDVSTTFQLTVNDVNAIPTLETPIVDTNAIEDRPFVFTISGFTFDDQDAHDSLTLSASSSTGGPLPSWLSFDPLTATFTGTPQDNDVGLAMIRVTATDTRDASVSDEFQLTVIGVNEPPMLSIEIDDVVADEDISVNFGFPSDTFVDPDVGDQLSYSTSLSGGLLLPDWLSFDAETRSFTGTPLNSDVGTLSILVTASDLAGLKFTTSFDLQVRNANDPPTSLTLSETTVSETTGPKVIGTVAVVDDDTDDTHSFDVSDDRFEVVNGSLQLTAGAILDHESDRSVSIEITVTDNGVPPMSVTQSFTILVGDVNEFAPDVENGTVAIPENRSSGTFVTVASAIDQDTSQTLSYAISGGNEDNAFAIDPSTGRVTVAIAGLIDHESQSRRLVEITVTDSGTPARSGTSILTIEIEDVNEPPFVANSYSDQSILARAPFEFALSPEGFIDPEDNGALDHSARLLDGSPIPDWIWFDPRSLTFSGLADDQDAANVTIEVTATDSGDPPLTTPQSFRLTVVANPFPWQNPLRATDVNRDTYTTALDALVIINYLGKERAAGDDGALPVNYPGDVSYLDPNADGRVSALDALVIINQLARQENAVPSEELVSPRLAGHRSLRVEDEQIRLIELVFADPSDQLW